MFIFTLKYHDGELYQRTATIKALTEKEAHDKLKTVIPNAIYMKTESIKEE